MCVQIACTPHALYCPVVLLSCAISWHCRIHTWHYRVSRVNPDIATRTEVQQTDCLTRLKAPACHLLCMCTLQNGVALFALLAKCVPLPLPMEGCSGVLCSAVQCCGVTCCAVLQMEGLNVVVAFDEVIDNSIRANATCITLQLQQDNSGTVTRLECNDDGVSQDGDGVASVCRVQRVWEGDRGVYMRQQLSSKLDYSTTSCVGSSHCDASRHYPTVQQWLQLLQVCTVHSSGCVAISTPCAVHTTSCCSWASLDTPGLPSGGFMHCFGSVLQIHGEVQVQSHDHCSTQALTPLIRLVSVVLCLLSGWDAL
jgi:hypothetical protein